MPSFTDSACVRSHVSQAACWYAGLLPKKALTHTRDTQKSRNQEGRWERSTPKEIYTIPKNEQGIYLVDCRSVSGSTDGLIDINS